MKILLMATALMLSLPTLGATSSLNFQEPVLEPQMILTLKPLKADLIRLFMRLPINKRMVAGYTSKKDMNL